MARWRSKEAPRLEAPAWYRTYDPAAWDEPDAWELSMMDQCGGRAWPDSPKDPRWPHWPVWIHDQHARRRWGEAKYAYLQAHPAFAEQEFDDIRARSAERRQ